MIGRLLGSIRTLVNRLPRRSSAYGCCTCGADRAVWVYWGACQPVGTRVDRRPDWAQCDPCHVEDSEHGRWLRSLPHARVEPAEGEVIDGNTVQQATELAPRLSVHTVDERYAGPGVAQ
jgi:hypothetical protein